MNRVVAFIFLFCLSIGASLAQDRERDEVVLLADGRTLSFPRNAQPFLQRGNVLVPIKETSKQLKVRLKEERRGEQFRLSFRGSEAIYQAGERGYTLNGDRRRLPVESVQVDRQTYVSVDLFRDLTKRDIVARRPGEVNLRPIGDLDIQYRGRVLRFGGREVPFEERGTLYLPVRSTARQTNVDVDQCDSEGIVLKQRGDRLAMDAGRQEFVVNGRLVHAGATTREIEGCIYAPLVVFETLLGSDLVCEGASWRGDRPRGIGTRREITLMQDGRRLGFGRDAQPYRRGGDNFVPLFDFARKIDVRFQRLDREGHRIRLTKDRVEVVYEQPLPFYEMNGRRIGLRQGSESVRNVLFVPLDVFDAFTNGSVSVKE